MLRSLEGKGPTFFWHSRHGNLAILKRIWDLCAVSNFLTLQDPRGSCSKLALKQKNRTSKKKMSKSKICSQTFLLGINRYKVFMKMLKNPDILCSEAQENSVLLDF